MILWIWEVSLLQRREKNPLVTNLPFINLKIFIPRDYRYVDPEVLSALTHLA